MLVTAPRKHVPRESEEYSHNIMPSSKEHVVAISHSRSINESVGLLKSRTTIRLCGCSLMSTDLSVNSCDKWSSQTYPRLLDGRKAPSRSVLTSSGGGTTSGSSCKESWQHGEVEGVSEWVKRPLKLHLTDENQLQL